MAHQIGVVRYGGGVVGDDESVHAWVLDLPGCIVGAPNEDALAAPLGLGIAEYLTWLRRHGEAAANDTSFEASERLNASDFPANGDFIFDADCRPIDAEARGMTMRLLSNARDDLADAVRELPDEILDWIPPHITVAHTDPWAPDPRTIRGILTHSLQLEVFYRGSLRDGPAPGIFERVGSIDDEHAETVALLESLAGDDWHRVFQPVHPGQKDPGAWTVRKLLRRQISHARHHAAEIRQRLAWLLVGMPEG